VSTPCMPGRCWRQISARSSQVERHLNRINRAPPACI